MKTKIDLTALLRDRDKELQLRQKTERHLTQQDIRELMELQQVDDNRSLKELDKDPGIDHERE